MVLDYCYYCRVYTLAFFKNTGIDVGGVVYLAVVLAVDRADPLHLSPQSTCWGFELVIYERSFRSFRKGAMSLRRAAETTLCECQSTWHIRPSAYTLQPDLNIEISNSDTSTLFTRTWKHCLIHWSIFLSEIVITLTTDDERPLFTASKTCLCFNICSETDQSLDRHRFIPIESCHVRKISRRNGRGSPK